MNTNFALNPSKEQQENAAPIQPQYGKSIRIMHVDSSSGRATIYQAVIIETIDLPVSIFEASAIGQEVLVPNWQHLPDPSEREKIRRLVFALAGKEQADGLHILPELPKKPGNGGNCIVRVIGRGRATR
jgi:hypothetical protein